MGGEHQDAPEWKGALDADLCQRQRPSCVEGSQAGDMHLVRWRVLLCKCMLRFFSSFLYIIWVLRQSFASGLAGSFKHCDGVGAFCLFYNQGRTHSCTAMEAVCWRRLFYHRRAL